jgi:hypothetical protein
MAETTSTRLLLRRWSAGTDTFSRAELDTSFANLEDLAAIDKQDTFANRPAAAVRGTYFWDTTNNMLHRDTGSAWNVVGSRVLDGYSKSSTNASVAFTVDTLGAGQTANLLELKTNAVNVLTVSPAGNLAASGTIAGKSAALTNTVAGTVALDVNGAASQSAALLRLRDNGGTSVFSVSNAGAITSAFASTSAATNIVGASTASSVANYSGGAWTGNAALEVRMNRSGAFSDFLYLNHPTVADASAATRRLGILMKVGAEDVSASTRSGAISLRSTESNFDNPQMVFDVAATEMWAMRPNTDGSATNYPVRVTGGFFRAVPTGDAAFHASNTKLGTQDSGNSMYYRVPTSGNQFMWYGGGVHSETLNDPGAGGTQWMSLNSLRLQVQRIHVTSNSDVDPSQTNPPILIGDLSGNNIQIDNNEIQAINDAGVDNAQLMLQNIGGRLDLGGTNTRTYFTGNRFHVGGVNPPTPEVNSIWIRANSSGGIFRWNGSSWVAHV